MKIPLSMAALLSFVTFTLSSNVDMSCYSRVGFIPSCSSLSVARNNAVSIAQKNAFVPPTVGVLHRRPAFLHRIHDIRSRFQSITAVLALDASEETVFDGDPEGIEEEEEIDPRAIFVPAGDNPEEISAFANLGLIPELCQGLSEMGITNPTPIQSLSLPLSLAGESVLLCAETGSGKTLSFLLPLLQRVKQDEIALGIATRPRRPRAVVLVPTRELGQQILGVAKELAKSAKFSSAGIFGGASKAEQARRLGSSIDLVVGTPGRLTEMVAEGHMSLGDVRFLVADEADTMASQGFGEDLQKLFTGVVGASSACKERYQEAQAVLSKLQAPAPSDEGAPAADPAQAAAAAAAVTAQLKTMRGPFHPNDRGHVQCVLAAATVAESVKKIMSTTFPKYREVKTPKAHRVPDRITQEFIPVTPSDRADRLVEVVDRGLRMSKGQWSAARELDGAARDATLVFCNTRDSALFAARLLREKGHAVAEAHGWVPQSQRRAELEAFAAGEKKVLVATDVMARGIDTIHVAHVVNFDFPLSPVDYLHRVGRTGRSGGTGRVSNLIGKRDTTLAVAIEAASRQRKPIENLSARRTDYVQGRPGLLKSEAPPPKARPPPAARVAVPAAKPPQRRAKPKVKDTTMKPFRVAQPKKKRSS